MRVAVIGAGVAGLATAYLLRDRHEVVVLEADDRPGGHVRTVRVDLPDETHHVDCGFIVHNRPNYPLLTRLFDELGVATQESDMSFSVSDERSGLEWNGQTPSTVFAQPRNLARPAFLRMLADIVRLNRAARRLLRSPGEDGDLTLGDFLARHRFRGLVVDAYVVPLASAIWSADPSGVAGFPARTIFGFLDNHGLLAVGGRPTWRTVVGGSSVYVDRLVGTLGRPVRVSTPVRSVVRSDDGIELQPAGGAPERFDQVVLACHPDQALALLADPSPQEAELLGGLRYQPNVVTLHTDRRMLPRARRAWASWNYHVTAEPRSLPTVTYHMNRLQRLESRSELCVTLNRHDEIEPSAVLGRVEMAHPVFDLGAAAAQRRLAEIQGRRGTWFAGAGWADGFHEDAMETAVAVAEGLGVRW
jgi:predicted NAD/FAD-binding protein